MRTDSSTFRVSGLPEGAHDVGELAAAVHIVVLADYSYVNIQASRYKFIDFLGLKITRRGA